MKGSISVSMMLKRAWHMLSLVLHIWVSHEALKIYSYVRWYIFDSFVWHIFWHIEGHVSDAREYVCVQRKIGVWDDAYLTHSYDMYETQQVKSGVTWVTRANAYVCKEILACVMMHIWHICMTYIRHIEWHLSDVSLICVIRMSNMHYHTHKWHLSDMSLI